MVIPLCVAAIEAMRQAGCCDETLMRVMTGACKPGALWHIYDPHDSDKIRHLLTKVYFLFIIKGKIKF